MVAKRATLSDFYDRKLCLCTTERYHDTSADAKRLKVYHNTDRAFLVNDTDFLQARCAVKVPPHLSSSQQLYTNKREERVSEPVLPKDLSLATLEDKLNPE